MLDQNLANVYILSPFSFDFKVDLIANFIDNQSIKWTMCNISCSMGDILFELDYDVLDLLFNLAFELNQKLITYLTPEIIIVQNTSVNNGYNENASSIDIDFDFHVNSISLSIIGKPVHCGILLVY